VLLPASHAPKKDAPGWPGFLTCGSLRRSARLPRLTENPVTDRGPESRVQGQERSVASRLQWRDRAGFSPASRGLRSERRIVHPTIPDCIGRVFFIRYDDHERGPEPHAPEAPGVLLGILLEPIELEPREADVVVRMKQDCTRESLCTIPVIAD
jgi:hypothetical protein